MGKRSAIDRAIDGVEDASMMLSKSRALAIRVLKAAKKDKARLDWLENGKHDAIAWHQGNGIKDVWSIGETCDNCYPTIRQAIDKAMRSEK